MYTRTLSNNKTFFLIAAMCITNTILGILYDGYDSKHYWWWEIVIQLRKFSVIFISAFIESREQQILLVLFVVVVSLFFTALLRPFYDDRLVRMEMLSLIVCFLTFFFGSMLLTDEKCVEDETLLCIGAQWLVILINAGCVLFLGINFGSCWFVEKGDLVNKDIWQFNHKLSHIEFLFNVKVCKINCNKKISLMKDNWYNLSDINIGIPKYQNKIIRQYTDSYG